MLYELSIQGQTYTTEKPLKTIQIDGVRYWHYRAVGDAIGVSGTNMYTLIDPAFAKEVYHSDRVGARKALYISDAGILYLLFLAKRTEYHTIKAILADCLAKGIPIEMKGTNCE